jgi:hypothetical protein
MRFEFGLDGGQLDVLSDRGVVAEASPEAVSA